MLALDRYGHDPAYPVSSNWPHLLRQLLDFIEDRTVPAIDGPVTLVGHSLGGYLSLMAACKRPDLCAGVVLLDSALIGGWRAHSLHAVKLSGLMRRMSPGRVSRRRRHEWPDVAAVRQHFETRSKFAAWDPRMLDDYAELGTEERDGSRHLSFERSIETRIYDTLPHNLDGFLKRHPLRAPAAFIGGTRSQEIHQIGLGPTQRLTHGRMSWIAGSHLFPFERPDETANAVLHWLAAFGPQAHAGPSRDATD